MELARICFRACFMLFYTLIIVADSPMTSLQPRLTVSEFTYVCTEADDMCLPPNAVCVAQTGTSRLTDNDSQTLAGVSFRCMCEDYYYFNYSSLQCLPGRLKECKSNFDCEGALLVCDMNSKRCGCDVVNNFLPLTKDKCEKRVCSRDEECSTGGQYEFACDLSVGLCRCAQGYFADATACVEIRGAPCAASGTLLTVCWYHGVQSNYYCDPLRRTCQCRPGFYSRLGRCTPGYQSSCSSGRQCSRERNMGENSVCSAGKCICAMGFLYNERSYLCRSGLHVDCSDDTNRCARFGPAYTCGEDGICECSANYRIQEDSCQPVSSRGVGCYNDENCHRVYGLHSACLFFSSCSCDSGYFMTKEARQTCEIIPDENRILCPYVIDGTEIGQTWCRKADSCWAVTINGTMSAGCVNVVESLYYDINATCTPMYSTSPWCFSSDLHVEICIQCSSSTSRLTTWNVALKINIVLLLWCTYVHQAYTCC